MAQYQRSEYRQQFLPEVDHRLAVWQMYLNALNSFQGIDMFGASEQGGSMNISRTPQERFAYHLMILDQAIDSDKDQEFLKDFPSNIPDLLDSNPPNEIGRFTKFSDYGRYFGRIDKLMRRQGFYTTKKFSDDL